jgi:glycosyltransferase involved in cell wall biosynthesis
MENLSAFNGSLVGSEPAPDVRTNGYLPRGAQFVDGSEWLKLALTHHRLTVSAIIPALNEAENLPHVLPRIPSWVHEVLLVDGNSTDATVEVALQLRPDIRIIKQNGRGKGAAIRSGFAAATGEIIVLLDADGSMDPAEMLSFVGVLISGADYAKGSRFLHGAGTDDMPLYRRLGNWGFVLLTNLLFGTSYSDITYGYNAVWRCHAHALALEIDGWATEIVGNIRAARNGLRVVEVASFEHRRIGGEAKLRTISAGWTILKAILREPFVKLNYEMPLAPYWPAVLVDAPEEALLERSLGSNQ